MKKKLKIVVISNDSGGEFENYLFEELGEKHEWY